MRGEFIGVWSETWQEVWELVSLVDCPDDLYCELYRELATALTTKPSIEELAGIIDDPERSIKAFQKTRGEDLLGERSLVSFLEGAHMAAGQGSAAAGRVSEDSRP